MRAIHSVNILEGLFGTIERISGNNQWMETQPSFVFIVAIVVGGSAATAVIFPSCYFGSSKCIFCVHAIKALLLCKMGLVNCSRSSNNIISQINALFAGCRLKTLFQIANAHMHAYGESCCKVRK